MRESLYPEVRAAIRREPIAEAIRRLHTEVEAYERRFQKDSESALQAVRAGQMTETAEIAKWLNAYLVLTHLRNTERWCSQ